MSDTELAASGTEKSHHPIAAFDHKCCECGRIIPKGTMYWYFQACWPQINGWDSFHTCLKCEKIRGLATLKFDWDHCDPPFTELYEWIRESRR